uniref:Uncharacterized protein n=1 Tax=Eucampia antarctica TaxID=49252 RepID=A0A7S2S2V6_9STRA|mmetsp:Transcript_30242/g.29142  ORF Transcript_30242/g.29142 Transcript_30242/m.29142 type:complete len:124 (+) Transcript_30242:63-434(+)
MKMKVNKSTIIISVLILAVSSNFVKRCDAIACIGVTRSKNAVGTESDCGSVYGSCIAGGECLAQDDGVCYVSTTGNKCSGMGFKSVVDPTIPPTPAPTSATPKTTALFPLTAIAMGMMVWYQL